MKGKVYPLIHIKDVVVKRVRQKPNVIARKEEDCYLLIHRRSGKTLVTNDIGFEAWNLFTGVPVREVVKTLANEYEVEETECQEEVLKLIQKLAENDFIDLI